MFPRGQVAGSMVQQSPEVGVSDVVSDSARDGGKAEQEPQVTTVAAPDAAPRATAQVLPVRVMNEADLKTAFMWSKTEGWNPGVEDSKAFHAADPEGWFMAHLDDEPVASLSAVKYGDNYGFIGM